MDGCCMCKSNGESVDHPFLHCDVASAIWSVLFIRFGMPWVMPRRVIELYDCWRSSGRQRSVAVWKMVPTCFFWCLWKEGNDRNFEDRERFMGDIISMKLCIFGRQYMCLLFRLVLVILFFVLLFLVRLFLLCTFFVLRGASHFFWCLWKEGNDRNFEDRERFMGDIISIFFETLYL
jgi:hypothetical protein